MKAANLVAMLVCVVFCVHAEWLVYQHYLTITRDYYPVMGEFYKMYAERLGNCFAQCSACLVGIRVSKFSY
jgi:hypothetical protein